ncbi:TPA: hypothetical protein ACH3X1_005059 [Trebouxia sp. C0004]
MVDAKVPNSSQVPKTLHLDTTHECLRTTDAWQYLQDARRWSRWLITKHYLASTNCTVSVRSPLRRDHTEGL